MAAVLIRITALLLAVAPQPAFVHSAPAQARAREPLAVDGTLTAGEFDELVLLYRGPGQDYVAVKLELQYGDLYRATIPAARMVPPGVEYYVEGRRKGERVPLFMTARKPARVLVLAPEAEGAKPKPDAAPPARSGP